MTSREFAKLLRRRTFVENTAAKIMAETLLSLRLDYHQNELHLLTERSVNAAETLAEQLEKSGGVSWTMEDAV